MRLLAFAIVQLMVPSTVGTQVESRTRSYERLVGGGFFRYINQRTGVINADHRSEGKLFLKTITDYTKKEKDYNGLLPSSNMLSRTTWVKPVYVSGEFRPASLGLDRRTAHGFIPTFYTNIGHPAIGSSHASRDKGDTFYVNLLMARTNPFGSDFSVPVFLREIFEISTMFKLAGTSLLSLVGSTYLNYKFGWDAFLRDLKTLASLSKAILKRLVAIRDLSSQGGHRRTSWLDYYSTVGSKSNVQLDSNRTGQEAYRQTSTRTEVYGTIRWFPAPGAWRVLEDLTDLEERTLALRVSVDLFQLEWSTIWDSIPFSWLADYFYDLGSYLEANRGFDLASPDYACIIRKTTITTMYYPIKSTSFAGSWRRATQGRTTTEIYDRKAVTAVASLPTGLRLLSASQALTLSALVASFSKGYR